MIMRLSQRESEGEVELVPYSLRNFFFSFCFFFSVSNGSFTFLLCISLVFIHIQKCYSYFEPRQRNKHEAHHCCVDLEFSGRKLIASYSICIYDYIHYTLYTLENHDRRKVSILEKNSQICYWIPQKVEVMN